MNWELANTATALGVEAWEQLEADFRHQRRFRSSAHRCQHQSLDVHLPDVLEA